MRPSQTPLRGLSHPNVVVPSIARHQAKQAAPFGPPPLRLISAASSSSQQSSSSDPAQDWDRLTDRLVSFSAIPFSVLVLPQVIQNTISMCSGQSASLSIISWEVRSPCSSVLHMANMAVPYANCHAHGETESIFFRTSRKACYRSVYCLTAAFLLQGYLSGLLGNTLMCTHFAGRGQRSAVQVELIGIVNNMMVLLQASL